MSNRLAADAKQIWDNYYPFYTEASGCLDLAGAALCFFSVCRTKTFDEECGMDFIITRQSCMSESAKLFTTGVSKLALPMILTSAYLIYKSYA